MLLNPNIHYKKKEMISILTVSDVNFAEEKNSDLRRKCPIDNNDLSFDDKYDYDHIFYDIFYKTDRIYLLGPPLNNLKEIILDCDIYLDEILIDSKIIIHEKPMISRCHLDLKDYVKKDFSNIIFKSKMYGFELSAHINPSGLGLFENSKCLMTLNKDNELIWIIDWLQYYVDIHKVDSVILYDNDSVKYSIFELCEAISKVKGLKKSVIIPWNYKYGPVKPNKYYFHYSQYVMLEHARLRFLSNSEYVFNVDIDELILVENDGTVEDILACTETAGVIFSGEWIEPISIRSEVIRHSDYYFSDKYSNEKCPPKWIVRPKMIEEEDNYFWFVHGINDKYLSNRKDIIYRHFKAINTSWKSDRTKTCATLLEKDDILRESFNKVNWLMLK